MSQQFSRAQRSDASVFPEPSYAWAAPGKALTVRLPFDLIDRLERLAVDNFRSIDALGSEIGGLLFGGADPGDPSKVLIEDFEQVACDYSRGPFYRPSNADLARIDAAIEKRGGAANARVAGFFRSHSRKGLALDAEDMQVMTARFAKPWQIAGKGHGFGDIVRFRRRDPILKPCGGHHAGAHALENCRGHGVEARKLCADHIDRDAFGLGQLKQCRDQPLANRRER